MIDSTLYTRETSPIEDLLPQWDRASFEVLCRRLEILLIRNRLPCAIQAITSFNGLIVPTPPSLEDHVSEVFPIRTANQLEEAGYFTVGAACKAKDTELLAVANFGDKTLRMVDAVRVALKNRTPLPRVVDESFPDLKPSFEIDWDYLALVDKKENRMNQRIENATSQGSSTTRLDVLMGILSKSDQTVAEIDAEIQKHELRIAELKRVRDILSPRKAASRTYRQSPANADRFREAEEKIIAEIKRNGPATARQLEDAIGESFTTIGKIVARSQQLFKSGTAIAIKP